MSNFLCSKNSRLAPLGATLRYFDQMSQISSTKVGIIDNLHEKSWTNYTLSKSLRVWHCPTTPSRSVRMSQGMGRGHFLGRRPKKCQFLPNMCIYAEFFFRAFGAKNVQLFKSTKSRKCPTTPSRSVRMSQGMPTNKKIWKKNIWRKQTSTLNLCRLRHFRRNTVAV